MTLFEKNYTFINQKKHNFHIISGLCNLTRNYILKNSRENKPALVNCDNKEYTVDSLYFPTKNASKMVNKEEVDSEIIIIFGLGLGYHFLEMKKKYPNKKFFIVEADKHLFNLFLKHNDISKYSENCEFFIGYDSKIVAKKLKFERYYIFDFLPLTKLYKNYYQNIRNKMEDKAVNNFSDKWKYKKFANQKVKILYIDSSYVLTKEIVTAINQLGQEIKYVHIDKSDYDYSQFIKNILKTISDFKPDFVLTINHLGFDQNGMFTELLNDLEIPFVSWFVDSPKVILSNFNGNISDYCNIFVWDRDYVQDVKDVGYKFVDYLPLATSEKIFFPQNIAKTEDIIFVGSSMTFPVNKNLKRFQHRQDLLELFEKTALQFLKEKSRYVGKTISNLEKNGLEFNFDSDEQKYDFEAAVLWRATQIYRLSGIKKLSSFYPTIFGDEHWENFLDNRFKIRREVLYYQELPTLYNSSNIVFNMTSRQMKNSVNQRIFDVPATKTLLITDYKSQLEEIFSKEDVVTFKDVNEIPELIKFYKNNEDIANKIIDSAYHKIIKSHTYKNRLEKMINIMRRRFS